MQRALSKASSIGPQQHPQVNWQQAHDYWGKAMKNGPPVAGMVVPLARAAEFINPGETVQGLRALGSAMHDVEGQSGVVDWGKNLINRLMGTANAPKTATDLIREDIAAGQNPHNWQELGVPIN
jgi:hypothetical protein